MLQDIPVDQLFWFSWNSRHTTGMGTSLMVPCGLWNARKLADFPQDLSIIL